ncbi:hypothetical protein GCM10017567_18700 [Amycolatopsis bullii]|uniref:Uncharacterized protein n=2 Tax=Pseudonocardiaceae TaxID=2070 RepID=A0ABQ3K6T2_9PSEU|nr:hypothetical protein [Amycolatopsis bullii]GHG03348.1 hypothetical protein GCM10017567_18700 [Amycolatopsis bullii]
MLIDLTENGDLHTDGVETVRATAATDVTALLLRPDSYVAWASSETHPGQDELREATRQWFGVPLNAQEDGPDPGDVAGRRRRGGRRRGGDPLIKT